MAQNQNVEDRRQNAEVRVSYSCVKRFAENEDLHGPKKWYCYPHFVQNLILIYGQKKSLFPLQLLVGPDWRVLSGTFMSILTPTLLFIFLISEKISSIMTYCTAALLAFNLLSLSFAAFSDPGIIFHREYEIDPEDSDNLRVIQCTQCSVNRPSTARHCYRCGVCVDKLDHHCAFVGKCIGKKNLIFFSSFVGSLYLLTYFVFGTTFYFLVFVLMIPAIKNNS